MSNFERITNSGSSSRITSSYCYESPAAEFIKNVSFGTQSSDNSFLRKTKSLIIDFFSPCNRGNFKGNKFLSDKRDQLLWLFYDKKKCLRASRHLPWRYPGIHILSRMPTYLERLAYFKGQNVISTFKIPTWNIGFKVAVPSFEGPIKLSSKDSISY